MDLISELVFIIRQKPHRDMDAQLPPGSKLRKFYDLLINNQELTDDEAAQGIYETSPKDKKYLMLKRNLINKLTDIVLNTEYFNQTDYYSIQFECEKELNIAAKLLIQNVFHNAEKILHRVNELALQYHLTAIQLRCTRFFRNISSLKGNTEKVIQFEKEIEQLSLQSSRIDQACGFFELLQSRTKFFISKSPDIYHEADSCIEQIVQWNNNFSNAFIEFYVINLHLIKHLQTNNCDAIFKNICRLELHFESFPFLKTEANILNLNFITVQYYRMVQHWAKALEIIQKCVELSEYKAFNKFAVQALHFDILMKLHQYSIAADLIQEVKTAKQFELIYNPDKAGWTIRESYLHYILLVNENKNEGYIKKFDVNKFSNALKPLVKDKQGYNLMGQVIRILFLFENQISDFQNEGENLRIYYFRYLKNANCERTKVFIKALYKLVSCNFDRLELEDKTQYFYKRLGQIPGKAVTDNPELIGYEDFWELIISRVKSRLKQTG